MEMKAGSHLWREGLLISPLSISPGGEERWLGGGGGRGRVSRSMSCSVETLSLRFPHICPSGKRWNEDNLKIISPTSSQTTFRFLVISSYWICRRRLASFPLIGFAGEGDSLINILGSVQSCVSHLLGSTLVTKYKAHPKDFLTFLRIALCVLHNIECLIPKCKTGGEWNLSFIKSNVNQLQENQQLCFFLHLM